MRYLRASRHFLIGLVALMAATVGQGLQAAGLGRDNPGLQTAIAAQMRHTPYFMSKPDVVGTAVGLAADGRPAVLIFTKAAPGAGAFPDSLEGLPVRVHVSGEIVALAPPPGKVKPGDKIDPTARFERPVPIGVSTGNAGECAAGTIGARVKDGQHVYALSNNHVYARENRAGAGETVLQPGRYDTNCVAVSGNEIGTLSRFIPIVFSDGGNKVDAAIAESSTSLLGKATPANGYGTPKSTPVEAALGMSVQKYGRTTGLTQGEIIGINATVKVSYDAGVATFVDQIWVGAKRGAILKAGDSGSLLVGKPGREPVGLLFAGDASGKYGVANRIQDVLNELKVAIDGE